MLGTVKRANRSAWFVGVMTVLAMAVMMTAPATAQEQSKPDEKLPDAEALLQKMVKALGGEATIRKHKHQTIKGTLEMPGQGLEAELVVHAAAPNLMLQTVSAAGFGDFLTGFNGEIAWSDDPMQGAQIHDGARRDQTVRQSDFHAPLNYHKNYKSIEVVGVAEFNDAECYELKLVDRKGNESTLYLDAGTYLPVGSIRDVVTAQGEIEIVTTNEEYEEFDGQMVATKTRAVFSGMQEQIVTFTDVSFEPFDHEVFELPDSIKALREEG